MRRSWPSRLVSVLLAVWLVVGVVAEPITMPGAGMVGMGMNMQGMSMAGMDMSVMSMSGMDVSGMDMSSTDASGMNRSGASIPASNEQKQNDKNDSKECRQHECCCSAISPALLTPEAVLSWLPAHVIEQLTPKSGNSIAHIEGQLRLPFANGPPSSVNS